VTDSYDRPADPHETFPQELARKAAAIDENFEDQCLDQMIRDARRALACGVDPRIIALQMGL